MNQQLENNSNKECEAKIRLYKNTIDTAFEYV